MNKDLIGKRLRKQRELLGFTREQFAEKIQISPQFLAEIENGTKGVSTNTLYKLGEFCSIDYLLFGKQPQIANEVLSVIHKLPQKYIKTVEDLIKSLTELEETS
ncbi:MAG: helix-turn-helix transcriptional regulator [Clostridia bacterium]